MKIEKVSKTSLKSPHSVRMFLDGTDCLQSSLRAQKRLVAKLIKFMSTLENDIENLEVLIFGNGTAEEIYSGQSMAETGDAVSSLKMECRKNYVGDIFNKPSDGYKQKATTDVIFLTDKTQDSQTDLIRDQNF